VFFVPCTIDNRFITLNQQNAEICSLDIDVKMSKLTFLHVTVHKVPSVSGVRGAFNNLST
jgi:hypothetical protein